MLPCCSCGQHRFESDTDTMSPFFFLKVCSPKIKNCHLLTVMLFWTHNGTFTWSVGIGAWQRECLKLGADATVIVTTANLILIFWSSTGLASVMRYGICIRWSDWLTHALALEKLKRFQLLLRATPVTRRNGPTIQFCNAWRHSVQSKRVPLTPHVNVP